MAAHPLTPAPPYTHTTPNSDGDSRLGPRSSMCTGPHCAMPPWSMARVSLAAAATARLLVRRLMQNPLVGGARGGEGGGSIVLNASERRGCMDQHSVSHFALRCPGTTHPSATIL